MSANPLAIEGCSTHSVVDWQALYYIWGIVCLFYGVVLYTSPFKLVPTTGKMKYAWMAFEAGIREESENRGDYDVWTTGQMHFAGVYMFGLGLFGLWAAESRGTNNEDFDAFTVLTIWSLLALVTFLKVLYADFEKWNNLVYGWAAAFIATAVLCIVNLVQYDGDAKQLTSKAGGSDIDTEGVLWFLFAFQFGGALNIIFSSFGPFEAFGPAFYIKEGYEQSDWSKVVQRFCGTLGLGFSMTLLNFAMNYDETIYGNDFNYPMAMLITVIFMLVWGIHTFVTNEQMFEDFAILQFGVFMGVFLCMFTMGAKVSGCFPEDH
jgi:hypothetical protein